MNVFWRNEVNCNLPSSTALIVYSSEVQYVNDIRTIVHESVDAIEPVDNQPCYYAILASFRKVNAS